jgi:hypothetical protein
VSITVLDDDNWHRAVTLMGTVVSIDEDPDLHDIDRLAVRYAESRTASATGRASRLGAGRALARLAAVEACSQRR